MSPCSLKDSFKSLNFLFEFCSFCSGFGDLRLFLRSHDSWEKWGKLYPFHLGEIRKVLFSIYGEVRKAVPFTILSTWKQYPKLHFPFGRSTESYTFHMEKVPKVILSTWKEYRKLYFPFGKSTESCTFHLKKKLYFALEEKSLFTWEKHRKLYFPLQKRTESCTFYLGKVRKVIISTWEKHRKLSIWPLNGNRLSDCLCWWMACGKVPIRRWLLSTASSADKLAANDAHLSVTWIEHFSRGPLSAERRWSEKLPWNWRFCVRELLVLGRQHDG